MKKILAILLVCLFITALSACSAQKKDAEPATTAVEATAANEPVSGGWTIFDNGNAAPLPENVYQAFQKAVEGLTGVSYQPVAFIGSQVVAGTNYAVLCTSSPVTENPELSLKVLIIYEDLDGNAALSKVSDFNLADYTEGEGAATEQLAGGWNTPEELSVIPLPEDAQAAFDKAAQGFTGNNLEPMALLGTQVVAGTNYAILCRGTLVTAEPVSSIQVATVYADLNGNSEITNICTVDVADFNK